MILKLKPCGQHSMFASFLKGRQRDFTYLYVSHRLINNDQQVFVYKVGNRNIPFLQNENLSFRNNLLLSRIKNNCKENDIIFGYQGKTRNRETQFLFGAKITKIINESKNGRKNKILVSKANNFRTFFHYNDLNKLLKKQRYKQILETLNESSGSWKHLSQDLIKFYDDIMKHNRFIVEDTIDITVFGFKSRNSYKDKPILIKNELLIATGNNRIKKQCKINDIVYCFGDNMQILYIAKITKIIEKKNGERQLLSDKYQTFLEHNDCNKYLKKYSLIDEYLSSKSDSKSFITKWKRDDINREFIKLFDDIIHNKSKFHQENIPKIIPKTNIFAYKVKDPDVPLIEKGGNIFKLSKCSSSIKRKCKVKDIIFGFNDYNLLFCAKITKIQDIKPKILISNASNFRIFFTESTQTQSKDVNIMMLKRYNDIKKYMQQTTNGDYLCKDENICYQFVQLYQDIIDEIPLHKKDINTISEATNKIDNHDKSALFTKNRVLLSFYIYSNTFLIDYYF